MLTRSIHFVSSEMRNFGVRVVVWITRHTIQHRHVSHRSRSHLVIVWVRILHTWKWELFWLICSIVSSSNSRLRTKTCPTNPSRRSSRMTVISKWMLERWDHGTTRPRVWRRPRDGDRTDKLRSWACGWKWFPEIRVWEVERVDCDYCFLSVVLWLVF